jgi:hypothetical protein
MGRGVARKAITSAWLSRPPRLRPGEGGIAACRFTVARLPTADR